MRTVHVRAKNLKVGDILNGQRIKAIHTFQRREDRTTSDKDSKTGVLLVLPAPWGNDLQTKKIVGHESVVIKRPLYNMEYRRVDKD